MERELTAQEKQQSRRFWEEIFAEDTKEFLDYYYGDKLKDNEILGSFQEEMLVSMLHLNPYKLCLGNATCISDYIVAVATKEEYRHQGRMARLLQQSLHKARVQGCPFVFLMPAKEEIYRPFDFVTVYGRKDYRISREMLEEAVSKKQNCMGVSSIYIEEITEATSEQEKEAVLAELIKYSQSELQKRYHLFAKRDEVYYTRLLKEQSSQQGGIFLAKYCDTDELCGYCFFTEEEELQLRELVCDDTVEIEFLKKILQNYGSLKEVKLFGGEFLKDTLPVDTVFPCIMVRITDVTGLAELISVKAEEKRWIEKHPLIEIVDSYFEENQGKYTLSAQKRGEDYFVEAEKLQNVEETEENIPVFTIEEITRKSFQNLKIFLNEIV
jgi:predicted acetyltransferase